MLQRTANQTDCNQTVLRLVHICLNRFRLEPSCNTEQITLMLALKQFFPLACYSKLFTATFSRQHGLTLDTPPPPASTAPTSHPPAESRLPSRRPLKHKPTQNAHHTPQRPLLEAQRRPPSPTPASGSSMNTTHSPPAPCSSIIGYTPTQATWHKACARSARRCNTPLLHRPSRAQYSPPSPSSRTQHAPLPDTIADLHAAVTAALENLDEFHTCGTSPL